MAMLLAACSSCDGKPGLVQRVESGGIGQRDDDVVFFDDLLVEAVGLLSREGDGRLDDRLLTKLLDLERRTEREPGHDPHGHQDDRQEDEVCEPIASCLVHRLARSPREDGTLRPGPPATGALADWTGGVSREEGRSA